MAKKRVGLAMARGEREREREKCLRFFFFFIVRGGIYIHGEEEQSANKETFVVA